ncbi:MAG: SBBP repeat-containing protein [Cyanobacteria bacterium J06649_5]
MDNQNSDFSVSLLTPASDLVGGSTTAELEILFGRAGNDVLYGFDPTANYPDNNIDILVGDLFDNSAEEFSIVLGITQGSPLGILDADIPSVGRDRFVLGDENGAFYTAPNPFDFNNNPLGTNEFAVIYDFDPTDDVIQLSGEDKDYSLIEVNDLEIAGVDRPLSGEAIFYNKGATPDLVGFIVSTPEQDFNFKDDKDAFDFVGDKGSKKGKKEIITLGTPGFDQAQNTTIDAAGNIYVVGSTSGSIGGLNQGRGDVYISKYNSQGNQVWLRQLGSAGSESAFEVVTDDNGDVYVAGDTSGNLVGTKQSSETDAWVAKFSGSNGDIIWGNQFNAGAQLGQATFTNTAFGLQVQDNSVYVSGLAINENVKINPATGQPFLDFSVEDDSWVTKLSASQGNQQWVTRISDPQQPAGLSPLAITPFFDENYDLAVDNAGNSYLVGWTQGLAKEADPSRLLLKYDAYLAKVDPTGQVEWVQQFGTVDEGLEFGWAVDTDSEGNVYTSGWTSDLKGNSSPGANSYDVFVSKFDSSGNQLVTKVLGTETDEGQYFSDLEIDNSDNVYLTGYTNNKKFGKGGKTKGEDSDAFVAKLDANLDEEWITQIGVKERLDYATGVSADNNGSVIVTGFTAGAIGNVPGGNIDGWVARLDDEKGKLDKFIGKGSGGGDLIVSTGNISVTDETGSFATDNALPNGDNDVSTGLGTIDFGGINDGFEQIFDPNAEGSFSDALVDRLQGGSGNGGSGNNETFGTDDEDKLKGEDTNDTMFGLGGDDKIEGKDGNDFLYGGLGSDEIKGGEGNDTIFGIDLNDSLLGGNDIDKLKGEKGADTFVLGNSSGVFYQGDGYAVIDDFDLKEGDRIQLLGSASDYSLGGKKGEDLLYQGDLIAQVKDGEDLSLTDTSAFIYVDFA